MDPISNMLVQIKNAQAVGKEDVLVPFSKAKLTIVQILKDNKFIADFERKKKPARPGKGQKVELEFLSLVLKYDDRREPAISGIKIVSRPSRHMYVGAKDIKTVHSGFGIGVISTSKGIMSSKDARKQGIGGEIMFEIW